MSKINLITVLGPTATGKTRFAANLAHLIHSEIISADSRQVYRGMDIGTGKDIDDYTIDGKLVPYHLIDIVDAGEKYNVYEYQSDFIQVFNKLCEQNMVPIMCGGSGLYLESVLKGYKLINVPVNENLRNELEKHTLPELAARLATFKKMHNRSDVDTKKRAIRAIEIAIYSQENPEIEFDFPKINSLIFGIDLPRHLVKERITDRLKQRLRVGMIEEVESLLKNGVSPETLMYYGLEYKFVCMFLNNKISYNAMFEKLNIAIHQFSKRQMTWFRKMEREGYRINWIDGTLPMPEKLQQAMNIIDSFSN